MPGRGTVAVSGAQPPWPLATQSWAAHLAHLPPGQKCLEVWGPIGPTKACHAPKEMSC
jgi:hypothetical protein